MARASNPKKFSLVYQELGSEARRFRGEALLREDLPDAVTLSMSGEARTLLPDELGSDSLRSMEAQRGSTDAGSSSGLPNKVEAIENFLRPIALCAPFSPRYLTKGRRDGVLPCYSSHGILRLGGNRAFIASYFPSADSCNAMRCWLEYIAIFRLAWSARKRSCDYLNIFLADREIIRGEPCVQSRRAKCRSKLPNCRLQATTL